MNLINAIDLVDLLTSLIADWHIALRIVLFVAGLALGTFCLVKFCDFFVSASSAIAKKMKISPLIIGLTIVAMGTSLPELAVSVSDSISSLSSGSSADVAIGNVIGSNTCNLLLVLGFSAIFMPIAVKKSICKKEFPILIGVTAVTALFVCLFGLTGVTSDFSVLRWEGIVLAVLMIAYIAYIIINAKKHPDEIVTENAPIDDMPWWKAILLVIVGALGIILGGQLVVFGAKGLSISLLVDLAGVEENLAGSLVGLTIVAVGTSLPELVTSVVAAKKGENEIALGNVIGSNIFNSLFVLGISATVNPLSTGSQVIVDTLFMLVITAAVFALSLKGTLNRKHGIAFVAVYGVYLTYLVLRTVFSWTF